MMHSNSKCVLLKYNETLNGIMIYLCTSQCNHFLRRNYGLGTMATRGWSLAYGANTINADHPGWEVSYGMGDLSANWLNCETGVHDPSHTVTEISHIRVAPDVGIVPEASDNSSADDADIILALLTSTSIFIN